MASLTSNNTIESNFVSSASAPGKVILFGDHAVVYGRSAVAASVSDLRVQVDASVTSSSQIIIHFVDLLRNDGQALKYSTDIESIRKSIGFLADENAVSLKGSMESRSPSLEIVQQIMAYPITHGECSGGEELTPPESKAIMSSIYLSVSIALPFLSQENDGLYIRVSSKGLPVGAGLGSSAALSVATSAALLRLSEMVRNKRMKNEISSMSSQLDNTLGSIIIDTNEKKMIPSEQWLQCINEWSFAAEVVMTGTPSGIDNTVSCFGKAVRYRRGNNGKEPQINILDEFKGLKILLTDTKVPRETKVLVAKVRELRSSSPALQTVFDSIFDSIENVTECFLKTVGQETTIENEELNGEDVSAINKRASTLQHLVRMNQELLNSIGVGHVSLDKVCQLGRNVGFETKLTGAGGGGCAFTLLEPRNSDRPVDSDSASLVESLNAEGYACYKSRIAGAGVLWLDSL